MNLDRLRWQFLLFSLCVAVLLAASFLGGGALLAQAYEGHSLPALNRLLGHAGRHPLDFYLDKLHTLLVFGLILWLVLTSTAALALHRLRRPGGGRRLARLPDICPVCGGLPLLPDVFRQRGKLVSDRPDHGV